MSSYRAPLEEISFVLEQLTDLSKVAEFKNNESLGDQELVNMILDQAARFSEEVLAPLDVVGDQNGAKWKDGEVTTTPGFKEAYQEFIKAGWNNVSIPEKNGGQGMPNLISAAVQEMLASSNKAFCYTHQLTASGVKTLLNAASAELQELYIPKLVSGEWTATMNLTEPHAGSDVGALRTRAVPQNDGSYHISGQKIYISCGEHDLSKNIIHLVLARIAGAPEGSRGLSLFVVPKFLPDSGERNDLQCTGIEHKLGNHGSPTCTMVYGDAGEGAKGWLVGEENKGLQAMFVMVNSSRFNVGFEALSCCEKAYQQALAYARERVQGKLVGGGRESVLIIKHPDVRRMLLLMRSQTEAIRALGYVLAEARDFAECHPDPVERKKHQSMVEILIPIFKGWASETGNEVTSMAIQVWGGMGYIEESGVTQSFRDQRISTIYEGTTGIQAHDLIERKLVRNQGESYRCWQEQLQACLLELKESTFDSASGIADQFEQSLELLDLAVKWLVENYDTQPQYVLAGSVPFLRMCGIVAGGWQMARSALAASRLLESGTGNTDFLRRKLASVNFYFAHVMPEVATLSKMATSLGEVTLALEDDAF